MSGTPRLTEELRRRQWNCVLAATGPRWLLCSVVAFEFPFLPRQNVQDNRATSWVEFETISEIR
jgi:hypothetical protein